MQAYHTEASPRTITALPSVQNASSLFQLHEKIKTSNKNSVVSFQVGNQTSIEITGKKLTEVHPHMIELFPSALQHISLRQNLISKFPFNLLIFSKLQVPTCNSDFLQVLDLSENRLTLIPIEISHLGALRELYLNNNQIKLIPSLDQLTNLQVLSLSYNWIQMIPSELPWVTLRCIYLDKNLFRTLPLSFRQMRETCQNIRLDWFRYDTSLDLQVRYARPELPLHFETKQHAGAFRRLLIEMDELAQAKAEIITFQGFVEAVSESKVDFLARDHKGKNLLFLASSEEHIGVIKDLATYYPTLMEQYDNENHTPLSLALLEQRVRSSQVLLDCGANPNQRNGPFGSCLHLAVFKRSVDMVQRLLQVGADVNSVDSEGNNALHFIFQSWSKGDPFISQHLSDILLSAGIDPNHKNKDRWAPLHLATRKLQLQAIQYAIKSNRSKSKKRHIDQRRRSSSVHEIPDSCVRLFNFNRKGGPQGLTIVQLAATTGVVDIIQTYFSLGMYKRQINSPLYMDILRLSKYGQSLTQVCYPALILKKWSRKLYSQRLTDQILTIKRRTQPKKLIYNTHLQLHHLKGDQLVEDFMSSHFLDNEDTFKVPRTEETNLVEVREFRVPARFWKKRDNEEISFDFVDELATDAIEMQGSLSDRLQKLTQLTWVEVKLRIPQLLLPPLLLPTHYKKLNEFLKDYKKSIKAGEQAAFLKGSAKLANQFTSMITDLSIKVQHLIQQYQALLHPKVRASDTPLQRVQFIVQNMEDDGFRQFRAQIDDTYYETILMLLMAIRKTPKVSPPSLQRVSYSTRSTLLHYEAFQSVTPHPMPIFTPREEHVRPNRLPDQKILTNNRTRNEEVAEEQKINLSHSTQILVSPFRKKRI